jgi:hypothetical protein
MAKAVAFARDEARAGSVDFEESAEAVVLQFKEPTGIVEGGGTALEHERRDPWRCGSHNSVPVLRRHPLQVGNRGASHSLGPEVSGHYGTEADRFAMSGASGLIAAALVRKS